MFNMVKWSLHFNSNPYRPLDFRTYYLSAASYWQEEENPYSDRSQRIIWQNTRTEKDGSWAENTGYPHAVAVYAPHFLVYFLPYTLMDFDTSKFVQLLMNLLSVLLIIFIIKKLRNDLSWLLIGTSVFAFKGTWYALDLGQPMLQILAISLAAYFFTERKKWQILPGILLGLMAFKFTLILPFILYLFITRNYKSLAVLFTTIVFLVLLVYNLNLIDFTDVIGTFSFNTWFNNMNKLWAYPHVYHEVNGLNIISSSVTIAMKYFFNSPMPALKLISIFGLLSGYAFLLIRSKKTEHAEILLLGFCFGLLFGQHLIYDGLFLIVCLLLTYKHDMKLRIDVFFLLMVLCLPTGTIADKLHMEALHFLFPIAVLIYTSTELFLLTKKGRVK